MSPKFFGEFKSGLAAGVPILVGYLPVAVAFGILSKTTGLTPWQGFSISAFVFAGASQFIALNLLAVGAGLGEIILTTFIVNLRHLLMSASLSARITAKQAVKPFLAFGVTDEVFSVASFREGGVTPGFLLALELTAYSSWVAGTVLGYLLGAILPPLLSASMGIALYAMFVALLVPQARKSRPILFMAIAAAALNSLLCALGVLSQSWNLLISIIVVAAGGALLTKESDQKTEQQTEEVAAQ